MPLQRGGELPERVLAAQLGIDPRRIYDVVAVPRAFPRRGNRRGIEMAHAELGEVRHQRFGIGEGEAFVELQALGCTLYHDRRSRISVIRLSAVGCSSN